jgi:hypothetical protein
LFYIEPPGIIVVFKGFNWHELGGPTLKQLQSRKNLIGVMLVLGLGLFGGTLFFPMNMNNRFTCLYHSLFSPDHSYLASTTNDTRVEENKVGDMTKHTDQIQRMQREQEETIHDALLREYVIPFGILWWASLITFAAGVYWLKRQLNIKIRNRESSSLKAK